MKNFKIKKTNILKLFYALILISFFSISIKAQNNFAVVYDSQHPNIQNLQYVVTTIVTTPCGTGELVTKKDIQGRKIIEETWCQGRRCGLTKIYENGVLVKLIDFYRDLILSYKSYKNGVIVTEISADRNRIVNNGIQIIPAWDKVYIPTGNQEIVILKRNEIIDLLSLLVLPEEITSFLEGLNDAAKNSLGGGKTMLACGGNLNPIKDVEADLKSTSTTKKAKA